MATWRAEMYQIWIEICRHVLQCNFWIQSVSKIAQNSTHSVNPHKLPIHFTNCCQCTLYNAWKWSYSIQPNFLWVLGERFNLPQRGHVTSSVTWPFDSRYPFPISTPLSPSRHLQPFPKYWAPNILGVTTLTFRGHVTSSVTWLLDSRWSIS